MLRQHAHVGLPDVPHIATGCSSLTPFTTNVNRIKHMPYFLLYVWLPADLHALQRAIHFRDHVLDIYEALHTQSSPVLSQPLDAAFDVGQVLERLRADA